VFRANCLVMIRKGTCVIVGLLVLAVAGCGSDSDSSGSGSGEVTVSLAEQNGSGESGTATLTEDGDRTKVVIEIQGMSGTMGTATQPAHIHKGSCADLDATPEYALADVTDGTSTSTVAAKLDDLRNGAFAINVHMSADEIETYVACGDVGEGDGDGTGAIY
jgi:hypothetical protein